MTRSPQSSQLNTTAFAQRPPGSSSRGLCAPSGVSVTHSEPCKCAIGTADRSSGRAPARSVWSHPRSFLLPLILDGVSVMDARRAPRRRRARTSRPTPSRPQLVDRVLADRRRSRLTRLEGVPRLVESDRQSLAGSSVDQPQPTLEPPHLLGRRNSWSLITQRPDRLCPRATEWSLVRPLPVSFRCLVDRSLRSRNCVRSRT